MPSMDDLSTAHPVAPSTELEQHRNLFASDFGDITGTWVQNGSVTEFHATLDGRPIKISVYTVRGIAQYVINGNTWHPSGDFRTLELAQRQQQLIDAVRRYL